jgi:hypothetical protein
MSSRVGAQSAAKATVTIAVNLERSQPSADLGVTGVMRSSCVIT